MAASNDQDAWTTFPRPSVREMTDHGKKCVKYGGRLDPEAACTSRFLDTYESKARLSKKYKDRLREMFESSRNSDLTILCGSEKFHVHNFQLSQHSEVFDIMLNGRFKEGGQREIELHGDDPAALREVFRYMYTFKYYPRFLDPDSNGLLLHLRVAALADKYDVADLPGLAFAQFSGHAYLADNSTFLAETITAVYSNDELDKFKAAIVKRIREKLSEYREEPDDYAAFWSVVENNHAFAVDLLRPLQKHESLRPF